MARTEKHLMTPMAPLGFGFTLWVVMLSRCSTLEVPSSGSSGTSDVRPADSRSTARAFGPAVIQGELLSALDHLRTLY